MNERKSSNIDLTQVHGEIPLRSLYTAGIAGEGFLRALKERGVLLASPCRACREVYVPARIFCERCFAELTERVEVGPGGRVLAVTFVSLGMEGEPLPEPVAVAAVRLDGATTSLVHRLRAAPGQARIGTKVKTAFRPESERIGGIADILHFEIA
jgi:uncharacterized OB-fold protein